LRIGGRRDRICAKVSRIGTEWTRTASGMQRIDARRKRIGCQRDRIRAKLSRIGTEWTRTPSGMERIEARRKRITSDGR
jgi:hypothetical protein